MEKNLDMQETGSGPRLENISFPYTRKTVYRLEMEMKQDINKYTSSARKSAENILLRKH